MMIIKTAVAFLLLAVFTLEVTGQRIKGYTKRGSCKCINPWRKNDDGKRFCKNYPNACYVSCNSDCRDKKFAKGEGRCQSKLACDDRRLLKIHTGK